MPTIKRALVSVSDKSGILELCQVLKSFDIDKVDNESIQANVVVEVPIPEHSLGETQGCERSGVGAQG